MYYFLLTISFLLLEIYLFLNLNTWNGLIITLGCYLLNIFFHKTLLKGWTGYLMIALTLIYVLFFTNAPSILVPATFENAEYTSPITVSEGEIIGVYNKDKTVEVYAGIPYAKAPIGDLRWKEPQDVEPYPTTLYADHFAPMAMQPKTNTILSSLSDIFFYKNLNKVLNNRYTAMMSEDALYLNIWKPANNKKNLPAVFYIHGGSLTTGQSWWNDYNGESYAKEDVIFITFGYRLGIFGFYADEELQSESANNTTGMYGFLDQVKALEWINENIESFGGDPNNITIAGESAGSSSVNAHGASPLSKGLFKKSIMESSTITASSPAHSYIELEEALIIGKNFKKQIGVNTISDLRKMDAEALLKTKSAYSTLNALTNDGYALKEAPYLTYLNGDNNEEAILNGYNEKDGDFFLLTAGSVNVKNYEQTIRNSYPEIAEKIIKLYPATTDKEAKENFKKIYNAYTFGYGHHILSELASKNIPVYRYIFTKDNKAIGSNHTGELYYAYGTQWQNPSVFDQSDKDLENIMMNYWLSFIKTGNPNNEKNPQWYLYQNNNVLELGETVEMIKDPNSNLYELLEN